MEEQNNNSNQNGQYTFFNMKDDHGFNDNITSNVEDAKKKASGRIVFIIAMIIVGISAAMIIRGVVSRQVDRSNYYNTYNSIVETRNKIHNRIQDLRN